MAYTKTTFVDSSAPAISAAELNKIGTGIEDAHTGALPPWRFLVEDYGAVGDGRMVGDVAVTTSSGVITSATASFTAGDVGKHIMVNGGLGAANIPLLTTIASYQSATQVTLADNASTTTTGLPAIWGTDDTSAIQDAIDAAGAYAEAHEYYAEVAFRDKYYIVAAAPTQTASPYFNSQLTIPYPASNTVRKMTIAFLGAGPNAHFQYWAATVPNILGTCLVSTQTAPSSIDGTYGPQSVLGGPTAGGYFSGGFANVRPVIYGICVVCPTYTNMTAINLNYVAGCFIDESSAHIFTQPLQGGGVLLGDMWQDGGVFASRQGVGLRTPVIGNNADVTIPDFASEGYTVGMRIPPEHVLIGNLKTIYNDVSLVVDMSGLSSQGHGLKISRWTPEACKGILLVYGSGKAYIDISLNTEDSGSSYDVSDSSNVLHGVFNWSDSVDSRTPIVTGGANVRFIDHTSNGPGNVTAPSVPATTVDHQNTFWRDAAVTVTGGTVTVIAVDGVATGLTSGTVIVPSGKNITLTYSSAPSWIWTLL